jgi:type 1 glutamine amidotransferase
MTDRIDITLVAAGKYHDIDFARLELLKLLAEHPHVRVTVQSDYHDLEGLAASKFLVTYTCDLRPSDDEQQALASWVEGGGRWLALHGTSAALDFTPEGVAAPRVIPTLAHLLGSQFLAHPPIAAFQVEVPDPSHPLVEGVGPFEVEDELYLSEYHEREKLVPLLETRFSGKAPGFVEEDWTGTDRHMVMYLRPFGAGGVLYNTLGHCRGHWDMRPVMDYYPQIERCAWEVPEYATLLRTGIRWGLGEIS